jgi:hypothetical protein
LEKLEASQLFIKLEKCFFDAIIVSFLSYIILPEGINMYLSKVASIVLWPTSTSVKKI